MFEGFFFKNIFLPSKLPPTHFPGALHALIIAAGILCCPVRATLLTYVLGLGVMFAAAGKRVGDNNAQETDNCDCDCQF